MKKENLVKQGKKVLMSVLVASCVCGVMAPSYKNTETSVKIVQNTNRVLSSNSAVEMQEGAFNEVMDTETVNNEELSVEIKADDNTISEEKTEDITNEDPTTKESQTKSDDESKDEQKPDEDSTTIDTESKSDDPSKDEVTPNEDTTSTENLSEEDINSLIKEKLDSLGFKDVNTDSSEDVENGIAKFFKEQFSEQLLKKIPYAGEFLSNLFNKLTTKEEKKDDAVVTELKNIKTCLEKIDKDLLDIDTKNNLQNKIELLNKLIENRKLEYDTYDSNLDEIIKQVNSENSSMNSFKEGVFASIYSVGTKKEITDEQTGKYVFKPTFNTQYLDDFIALIKGFTNLSTLTQLTEKGGSVIELQNKIYTYNFDFNTQTFKVRQQNIDDLKNLCYGRYNHLLAAIEFALTQQNAQFTAYNGLADCYQELLDSNSLTDAQKKALQTKLDNAIDIKDKANTLKSAVEKHLKELNSYKNEFDKMIDAAQKALNEESSKNVAHCYRNNVDYKKTATSFNSRDLLDENTLLNERNDRIDYGFNLLLDLGADYKYKPETKNSIQYSKGNDANIDYIVSLAKKRNMDLATYIDSVFDVQGIVTSMQNADGLYKTGLYTYNKDEINDIECVTTYTNKSGETVKTTAGVTFENEDSAAEKVRKVASNILTFGRTNFKSHVKIKNVVAYNKVLIRIEAA